MDPLDLPSPHSDLPPPPAYEQSQHAFDQKTSFAIQRSLGKIDEDGFEVWDDSLYQQALAARQSGLVAGSSSQVGSSSAGGYDSYGSHHHGFSKSGKEKSMWMMQDSSLAGPSSPLPPPPARARPSLPPIPTQQQPSPYQSLNIGTGSRGRGNSTSSSQTTSPVDEAPPPAWRYNNTATATLPSSARSTPTPGFPSHQQQDYRAASPQAPYPPATTPGRTSRPGSRPPSTNPQQVPQWANAGYNNFEPVAPPPPQTAPVQAPPIQHEVFPAHNHHVSLPPPQRPNPERPRITSLNTGISNSYNHVRAPTIPFNPLSAYNADPVERDARTGRLTSGGLAGHNPADFYNSSVSAILSKTYPAQTPAARPLPNTYNATSYQQQPGAYSIPQPAPYQPATPSPSSASSYSSGGYNSSPASQNTYPTYGFGGYGGPPMPPQQQQQQQFYPGSVGAASFGQNYGAPNQAHSWAPPGAQAPQNIYDRRY